MARRPTVEGKAASTAMGCSDSIMRTVFPIKARARFAAERRVTCSRSKSRMSRSRVVWFSTGQKRCSAVRRKNSRGYFDRWLQRRSRGAKAGDQFCETVADRAAHRRGDEAPGPERPRVAHETAESAGESLDGRTFRHADQPDAEFVLERIEDRAR